MAATRSGLHIPSTIAYPTRSSSATIADVDVVSRCRWRGAAAIGIYDESPYNSGSKHGLEQGPGRSGVRGSTRRTGGLPMGTRWQKLGSMRPHPPNAANDRTHLLHHFRSTAAMRERVSGSTLQQPAALMPRSFQVVDATVVLYQNLGWFPAPEFEGRSCSRHPHSKLTKPFLVQAQAARPWDSPLTPAGVRQGEALGRAVERHRISLKLPKFAAVCEYSPPPPPPPKPHGFHPGRRPT